MELTTFQEMIERIKPYETGVAALFSNDGKIAAHFDKSRLGKNILETERDMVGAAKVGMKTAFARYGDVFNTKITNADYELNDIIELGDIINKENKNNI